MSLRSFLLNTLFLPAPFWETPHGYVKESDFITAPSFGRNTYSDSQARQVIRAGHERFHDDLKFFDWLKSKKFDPGYSNKILGLRCLRLSDPGFNSCGDTQRQPGYRIKPVIGQWEVLYSMWLFQEAWYQSQETSLTPIWPSDGAGTGTRNFFRGVQNYAKFKGLLHPLVTAHPEHIQRCFFIARKIFGEKSVAIDYHPGTKNDLFDPKSVLWQTQGSDAWLVYEMLARIHDRLHGRM